MVESNQVCLSENTLSMYLFVLACVIAYLIYIAFAKQRDREQEQMSNVQLLDHLSADELKSKVIALQDQLYNVSLSEQKCQLDLAETRKNCEGQVNLTYTNRFNNPLEPPVRIYPGGRFNQSGSTSQFQQIGYVYDGSNSVRLPLFGRYKYPGRSDRWEYYVIDESRNRLKIPFKTKNDVELYDGDHLSIPTVGGDLTAKIYDYDEFRYDPNLL